MKYAHSKNIAWNTLGQDGSEIIAFNLSGDRQFHELNETASFIFKLLETPRSEEEIHQALLEEYDVTTDIARTEIQQILSEMVSKALIETQES